MVAVGAVLVVVSWVPMPSVTVVCALAGLTAVNAAAAIAPAETIRYPKLRSIADPLGVLRASGIAPCFQYHLSILPTEQTSSHSNGRLVAVKAALLSP